MSLPPFNPRRTEAPKADPGDGDDVPCVKCGAVALDTGLECSECGHDNYEAITGRPFGVQGADAPQEFFCNKCGYFGPVEVFHERPNGSGKCDYMAVPMKASESRCKVPPPGWQCSREPGHEGPCAARPVGVAIPQTPADDRHEDDADNWW